MSRGQDTFPNLFIVGAPKCGTTWMHEYLAQHLDIHMSSVKEPRFLSTDIDDRYQHRIRDADNYFALFSDAGDKRYRGESSVYYLYSDVACRRIGELADETRIIVMIRNPVDFIESIHGQFCCTLNETRRQIADALALEPERASGRRIPPQCHTPFGLQYRKLAHFADRIEQYFASHGRDRVHVIVFDDLKNDSVGVYQSVLSFLDLPPLELALEPKNRAVDRRAKNPVSERLLKLTPGCRRLVGSVPTPVFQAGRWALDRAFGRRSMDTRPMPAALRAELTEEFKPEVERLSQLLHRDLSSWSRVT